MRHVFHFLFLMFAGILCISAQSRSDFESRVENSLLKLYENPDVAMQAAREIRNEDKQWVVKNILSQACLLKGDYLGSVRIAFEPAEPVSAEQSLIRSYMIAREYYELGLYSQASKIISPLLSAAKKKAPKTDALYAEIFQLEAKNFIAKRQFESAQKSIQQSSDHAGNSAELIILENQLLAAAVLAGMKQRDAALNVTETLLKDAGNLPRAVYIRSAAYQLKGKLLFQSEKYGEAIGCLQRALLPVKNIGFEPLKRSIYADLMKNYLAINKNEEFDFYRKKFTESSRLLDENKNSARRELIQLNTEYGVDQNSTLAARKRTRFFYTVIISVSLVILAGFLYWREMQRAKNLARQIKFFRSVNVPLHKEQKEKELPKKPLLIPKEKEKDILDKLEQFEESKKYLEKNMTLATLSAQLGTNTKYLSEIINKYKDQNFNSYINSLRIKYIIQLLSTDRTYHQYKISYIAEIGGFTSHSAFTNIFKSVTGFSPNEYIQNLRNSES